MIKDFSHHSNVKSFCLSINLVLTIVFWNFICNVSICQTIELSIHDIEDKTIPFVNIYGQTSGYGTISDVDGIANIDLTKIDKKDSLQISCIGYKDKLITLDRLLSLENHKIYLEEEKYTIAGVNIIAKQIKLKNKKAGIRTRLGICQSGFYTRKESAGKELGIIMRNERECYIESINFNLTDASHDSMMYELNIYKFDNDVGQTLNPKRLFLNVDKSNQKKSTTINIRDQMIKVEEDFFVSFEAVQVRENNWGILFKAKCKGNDLCLVKNIDGSWKKETSSPAIWCKLNCIKK